MEPGKGRLHNTLDSLPGLEIVTRDRKWSGLHSLFIPYRMQGPVGGILQFLKFRVPFKLMQAMKKLPEPCGQVSGYDCSTETRWEGCPPSSLLYSRQKWWTYNNIQSLSPFSFFGSPRNKSVSNFYRNIQSKGACLAAGILSSKRGKGTGGLLCIFTHLIHLFLVLCLTEFFIFIFFISWRLITLQYCSGFCHTLTWISHGYTCIPHPDPPSHLPLHPIPLGLPSAPGPSTCLMHPTWAGDLFHPR